MSSDDHPAYRPMFLFPFRERDVMSELLELQQRYFPVEREKVPTLYDVNDAVNVSTIGLPSWSWREFEMPNQWDEVKDAQQFAGMAAVPADSALAFAFTGSTWDALFLRLPPGPDQPTRFYRGDGVVVRHASENSLMLDYTERVDTLIDEAVSELQQLMARWNAGSPRMRSAAALLAEELDPIDEAMTQTETVKYSVRIPIADCRFFRNTGPSYSFMVARDFGGGLHSPPQYVMVDDANKRYALLDQAMRDKVRETQAAVERLAFPTALAPPPEYFGKVFNMSNVPGWHRGSYHFNPDSNAEYINAGDRTTCEVCGRQRP